MKQTSKVFLWHSCRTVIAQWTTRDWGHPIVQWGTEPGGPLERQTNGSFTTYTKLQMCGAPRQWKRLGRPRLPQLCCNDRPAAQHPLLLQRWGPGVLHCPTICSYETLRTLFTLQACGARHILEEVSSSSWPCLQVLGMSRVYSFVSGPKVGTQSAVRFLAAADLGHTQSDGSTEFNHQQAHDLLNFTPKDTLQYVSGCLPRCHACS